MDYNKLPPVKLCRENVPTYTEVQELNINNNRCEGSKLDVIHHASNLNRLTPMDVVINQVPVQSVEPRETDLALNTHDTNSETGTIVSNESMISRPTSVNSSASKNREDVYFDNGSVRIKDIEALDQTKEAVDTKQVNTSGRCCQLFLVVFARLLYIVHGLLVVWRLSLVLGDAMWLLSLGAGLSLIELFIVLVKRKGRETKWFQPAVLIYLLWIVPCIWLLEIEKTSKIQIKHNSSYVLLQNLVKPVAEDGPLVGYESTDDWWATVMSQSALVVILLCRWLMPRGNLTRDQLSIVLLYYLGTASDIVDFFNVLTEDEVVLMDMGFFFTILTIWSWSLFQFVFISVEPTADDLRCNSISPESKAPEEDLIIKSPGCSTNLKQILLQLKQGDTWLIFVSLVMQDGPYAIVRLITLFHWHIHTYTNFLYALKNILMLTLQIYRIIAVYYYYKKEKRLLKEAAKKRRASMWKEALLKTAVLLSLYDPMQTDIKENNIENSVTSPEDVDQTLLDYVLKNQHRVSMVTAMTDISD